MTYLYELRDMLCEELKNITEKGELSAGSLETVHKLTSSVKNIYKIMILEGEEGGYSEDGGTWMARGAYRGGSYDDGMRGRGSSRKGGSYDGGESYANRGRHYVRGHYSRDEGRDHMMRKMEELMNSAGGEREREIIRRMMGELENV